MKDYTLREIKDVCTIKNDCHTCPVEDPERTGTCLLNRHIPQDWPIEPAKTEEQNDLVHAKNQRKAVIHIDDVTLLSAEEYEAGKDFIPPIEHWWWLRSPGSNSDWATYVSFDSIDAHGIHVTYKDNGVRPVIKFDPLYEFNSFHRFHDLAPGDTFQWRELRWTVIANDIALCNKTVGETAFRTEGDTINANDYASSDVRCWLQRWRHNEGIELDADIVLDIDYKEEKRTDSDQNAKADAGKLPLTLVPTEIIKAIAVIRRYGAGKYPDGGIDNWKRVSKERYRDAAFRHFLAYLEDPTGDDEESGLPHLWHLATNIAFLCELEPIDKAN